MVSLAAAWFPPLTHATNMTTATSSNATAAKLSVADILRWVQTSDGPTAAKMSVDG